MKPRQHYLFKTPGEAIRYLLTLLALSVAGYAAMYFVWSLIAKMLR